MDCKECPFDDSFWNSVLETNENSEELIRLYYVHSLSLSCLDNNLKLCGVDSLAASKIVLSVLERFTCHQIIDILKNNFKPYEIKAKDIPQFSSFDDCYYKVVEYLVDSGMSDISYDKMGYFLREVPRKLDADKKYGENHAKIACMLGFCSITRKSTFGINITPFGQSFYELEKEKKDKLMPKLCLFIPMIQNYFVQGMNQSKLDEELSILSPSTIIRRRSNVNTIISIISDQLDNELYGTNN